MSQFKSTNPYNGETFAEYDGFDLGQLDEVMGQAERARQSWQDLTLADRARHLGKLGRSLRDSVEELALLCSREMGKPLGESRAEVEKCAWLCEFYADQGEAMLADQAVPTDNSKSYFCYRPLGVLLGIMPWNFPYWQAFRFIVPALMAGNAIVLKHASNVPGCALAIERLLLQAGLPQHLFRSLLVSSDDAGRLISHPGIRGVSFTGSSGAGSRIASLAGEHLRKTVLELGGSDPYLVLADADLQSAAETCAASRLINNGQSCIAAKRFIVHTSVYEEFLALMCEKMASRKAGDPLQEDIRIGPLARPDLCRLVTEQVRQSVARGARCVLGGEARGNVFPATVLAEVVPGMPAFDDEIFGPVAAVIKADNEEHAIALANRSDFGLGAAVFTRDIARGERIARDRLEAGCCFVNALVASDPRLPFGGIKASGYGRELGPLGIQEFTNIKTVVVQ